MLTNLHQLNNLLKQSGNHIRAKKMIIQEVTYSFINQNVYVIEGNIEIGQDRRKT
jgi:hypothetical protein